MDNEIIGARLRELRGNKPLNEVAKEIGITPSALCNYERGFRIPRDSVKIKIAQYYKRTVNYIFFK